MTKPSSKMERTLGQLALAGSADGAAVNSEVAGQTAAFGPASSFSLSTPSFTPEGEGVSVAWAFATVTCSVPGATVTFQLKIASTIIAAARFVSDGTHGIASAFLQGPPGKINGSTTAQLVVTPSSGNVSVQAAATNGIEAEVSILELVGA
jgi:hypothetical protein